MSEIYLYILNNDIFYFLLKETIIFIEINIKCFLYQCALIQLKCNSTKIF